MSRIIEQACFQEKRCKIPNEMHQAKGKEQSSYLQNILLGGVEFTLSRKGIWDFTAESFLTNFSEGKDLGIALCMNSEQKVLQLIGILSKNACYLMLRSRSQANDMYKYLNRVNSKNPYWQPSFVISGGDCSIYLKNYLQFTQKLVGSTKQILKWASSLVSSSLVRASSCIPRILQRINLTYENSLQRENPKNSQVNSQSEQRLENIRRHLIASHFQKQISYKVLSLSSNSFTISEQKQIMREKNYYKFREETVLSAAMRYSSCIYAEIPKFSDNLLDIISISENDLETFSVYLKKPVAKVLNSEKQNKFIFNNIKMVSPKEIKSKRYMEGGSGQLRYFHPLFYYSPPEKQGGVALFKGFGNVKPEDQKIQKSKIIQKVLCVKLPKSNFNKHKIIHEKRIVEQLRNSSSGYLFKYYSCDQREFPFCQDLLIDFTDRPTLNDYLTQNSLTISLRTKFYILCQVAQAISFLNDSKIVHMDIKKSNIMVMRQQQVKIFDFSESFHPKVCGKDYEPGITMPYAPPEVFQRKHDKYDCTQDMFSFGILCFILILDRDPFCVTDSLINDYENKQYLTRLFLAQQIGMSICYYKLFGLFITFIMKCLNPNPIMRPTPSWAVIILKEIFAFFTTH